MQPTDAAQQEPVRPTQKERQSRYNTLRSSKRSNLLIYLENNVAPVTDWDSSREVHKSSEGVQKQSRWLDANPWASMLIRV